MWPTLQTVLVQLEALKKGIGASHEELKKDMAAAKNYVCVCVYIYIYIYIYIETRAPVKNDSNAK
jgi:hypothetical protein